MLKKITTKSRIINSAINLFYNEGIHWVSFQKIAKDVGISQPALYKHFVDKDDLIMACASYSATYGRELIDELLAKENSAAGKLKAYIEGNLKWIQQHPKQGIMVFSIYYFGFNHKALKVLLANFNQQNVNRIYARLELGNVMGEWVLANTKNTSRVIHDMVLGETIKMLHDPTEFTLQERIDVLWFELSCILKL